MAYPCDLPANMGNTDIFRAIYAKLSDINPSTGTIEQKLDVIQDQLTVVNNSIEANTQAIKDISINVDIHSKDIQSITKAINKQTKAIQNIQINIDTSDLTDSVQLVAAKVEDGFVKTVEAIKSIQHCPTPPVLPRPVPPCPPHPCPEPEPEPEPIFYPVTIGLPEPTVCYRPKKKRCECKCNHIKSNSNNVYVKPEQRPIYNDLHSSFDPIHTPYNPYNPEFNQRFGKIKYPKPKPKLCATIIN